MELLRNAFGVDDGELCVTDRLVEDEHYRGVPTTNPQFHIRSDLLHDFVPDTKFLMLL